jgi:hypothetical protein
MQQREQFYLRHSDIGSVYQSRHGGKILLGVGVSDTHVVDRDRLIQNHVRPNRHCRESRHRSAKKSQPSTAASTRRVTRNIVERISI